MRKIWFLILCVQLSFAQEVVLELSLQNIVIRGITNPIRASIENTNCNDVIITSKAAKIERYKDCSFSLVTLSENRELVVNFYKKTGKDSVFVDKRVYRVIDFPDPIPNIAGFREGDISEETFKSYFGIARLNAYSEYVCMDFKMTEYTMMVIRDTTAVGISKNIGNRASEETKKLIALVKPGDQVYITNLKCKVLNEERELDEMKFYIK
ncbi:GldM family protein [uncultured Psychroserpens sp.]|uniref:GldM family protein n=1 Tax=uncultured Psychroserpens sp. TaxID=255436 RepID=UPI00260E21DA|nr:GldM family protein [uncultured Psychroserpens sp.]